MQFLTYFIKEAQRLDGNAPTNLNQIAYEDFEVDGIKILKGTSVMYLSQAIHVHHE